MGDLFSLGPLDITTFIICGIIPAPFNILVQLYIRILYYNG